MEKLIYNQNEIKKIILVKMNEGKTRRDIYYELKDQYRLPEGYMTNFLILKKTTNQIYYFLMNALFICVVLTINLINHKIYKSQGYIKREIILIPIQELLASELSSTPIKSEIKERIFFIYLLGIILLSYGFFKTHDGYKILMTDGSYFQLIDGITSILLSIGIFKYKASTLKLSYYFSIYAILSSIVLLYYNWHIALVSLITTLIMLILSKRLSLELYPTYRLIGLAKLENGEYKLS